jgi:NADH dehydrogenase
MAENPAGRKRVLLTGASGFVGGHVLRRLIAGGFRPVCLARSPQALRDKIAGLSADVHIVPGDVREAAGLSEAARQADAAIHLVGIIFERGGQSFSGVHYEGTRNVVQACREAGIKRLVHMSALGTRPDAPSKYHQTKYMAEQQVIKSGLDWTIFRPSIIHGPDGEFMEMMKTFSCRLIPPIMPYFGSGENRLQPVDVRDVAECFVKALSLERTIHRSYDLGGPRTYSWKELYGLCRRLIPGARRWKPMVAQPVPLAKLVAATVMKVPVPIKRLDRLRFNVGQVQMSQEDSICDIAPAERDLDITFRDFEQELREYADQIR